MADADIVIATDRPIGFWEAANQPRTIDYPFTVIQMHLGSCGRRQGHAVVRDEDHRPRQHHRARTLRDRRR